MWNYEYKNPEALLRVFLEILSTNFTWLRQPLHKYDIRYISVQWRLVCWDNYL